MARKIIDVGIVGNDGTGDSIRDSFRKVNDNFRELYSSLGLGERLSFIGLSDTPDTYDLTLIPTDTQKNTPLVTVNNLGTGVMFKRLVEGNGISIDFLGNPNEIIINSDFAEISADETPQLGGPLLTFRAGERLPIGGLPNLSNQGEFDSAISSLSGVFPGLGDADNSDRLAVNKAYADSKIAIAGVDAINPRTKIADSAFGRMTGPLILSRDPESEDDTLYGGRIAATKAYVDSSAFGSSVNLYVALSGVDDRPGVSKALQGRALAYAYRTLEAALKRAEELVLEAREEIGPYKKVLTYNNGADDCFLSAEPEQSPISGDGFEGTVRMSVSTITLSNAGGVQYYPGDLLALRGGTIPTGGNACTIQVLTTATTPGRILTFKIVSTGVYSALPSGADIGQVDIIQSASPPGVGGIGELATFDVTYAVNSVAIVNRGSDYSLVSVRVVGGGGTGAFGTAVVVGGEIDSITITDKGTGFTSLPTLEVNLPRFLIFTDGRGTDFTGDVSTETPEAIRGRDIREGLFLRGESSGALAQIVSHDGDIDSLGNEIFDVDIKFGKFIVGEKIAYGDISKNIQISVLVESGEYYENYPLKVPQNTSIVGDEFRRVIFRPKPGTSSSPWAFQKFRRDKDVDGLTITTAENEFAYHYLTDPNEPVYPKISNKGNFTSAAILLSLNKTFFQEEIIAWIDFNIDNDVEPFADIVSYDQFTFKRNVGLLVDSFVFDLKYGEYNRTVSAALKYYESGSGLIAVTNQEIEQYLSLLNRLNELMQLVLTNTVIPNVRQTIYPQIIDQAYQSEFGSSTVVLDLITVVTDILDESAPGFGSVNQPKDNEEMDVFLANDAVRWQAISAQGHGGFMGVLDPSGQILAKSPYFQECSSFSRSKDRQVFAGGMFVDGFSGNLEFNIDTVVTSTRLEVSDLVRLPQLPCSFIVEDSVYRVNYIRNYAYDKDGSTATLILDETTPWPFQVFTYDSAACSRDVGLILDGLSYDIVFGTNYWTRQNGLTYRLAQSAVVIDSQRAITLEAINYTHELVNNEVTNPDIQTTVNLSNATIADIIDRGTAAAPILTFTLPVGLSTGATNAYILLTSNKDYIVAEVDGWIRAQIAGNISPWTTGDTYNISRTQEDTRRFVEATIYDLVYGGNLATRHIALKYYNNLTGLMLLSAGQPVRQASAIDWAREVMTAVIQNTDPSTVFSTLIRTTGSAATSTEVTRINNLITAAKNAVAADNFVTAQLLLIESLPSLTGYSAINTAARTVIQTVKPTIQTKVIEYVNYYGNRYELLMPGNRSMLANDYTQINDMGYGAVTVNGGLMELVSVFTYYCYTSYYSLRGGQIRSIGGSSAHGVYALVAEGADPLEVPTPTTVYEELSQRVICYAPSPTFANDVGGLLLFVTGYNYTPLGSSELEVDHSGVIFRYPVTSVTTSDLPPGVARLNLATTSGAASEGLFASIPNGTKMSMRANGQVLLTGGLEDVAVRPSTGLKLRETSDNVYRVLEFIAVSDQNGPYEISVTPGNPGIFRVLVTVTDIDTNVCTTGANHKLVIGDKFIPTASANGFISGVTYYIVETPNYNQFKVSTAPGGTVSTLVNGTGLAVKGVKTHKILENYTIDFSTSGTLPAPLNSSTMYYVLATDLTDTEFAISIQKNGNPVEITTSGTGNQFYNIEGLTLTRLRENYNYVDLTVWQPGEFVTSGTPCTISIGSPATITLPGHTFAAGDVIKFETTGNLPIGLTELNRYFVLSAGLVPGTSFRVSTTPEGVAVDTLNPQSGIHSVGLVTGRAGDISFAVVGAGSNEISRVAGSKFLFLGEEYTISSYQSESVTLGPYARVTLNRPLVDSIINYGSSYTIKSAVPIRSSGSLGTLTIRISLTRVTSHDLLEIGTGSYADTNYPKEIYGGSVNPLNPSTETQERDVGRCFYVTTDQFGNFNVGPFFRVDQGTGQVTFSSSIALSNLDGIGFKRGVPISEFSTDSAFTDNATDTVPTENAIRSYIDRRLGVSHSGSVVPAEQVIPLSAGGFLSLDGQLGMKGDLNLNQNAIRNVIDPVDPQDAVNLRSLTWDNIQNIQVSNPDAGDIFVFTGDGINSVNATVVGDITAELRTGVDSSLNQIDVQIAPGAIENIDINDAAAISQSKLNLQIAGTRASTPSGSASVIQAANGVASFDLTRFEVNNGWVQLLDMTIAEFTGFISGTTLTVSSVSVGTLRAGFILNSGSSGLTAGTIIQEQLSGTTGGAGTYRVNNSQTFGGALLPVTPASSNQKSMSARNTAGWVGVSTNNLQPISRDTVLGNANVGTDTRNVSEVPFTTVVNQGLAVKKSQYTVGSFLQRTGTGTGDDSFTTVLGSAGSSSVVGGGEIIIRSAGGDFGGRTADLQSIRIDNNLAIDTAPSGSGGFIRYYGWGSAGGILIQDGTLGADKKTGYWNELHEFRNQSGISAAPISCSQIQTLLVTSGSSVTNGTITGNWSLSSGSRMQATYSADLAEWYTSDKKHEAGTVLVFGGDAETTTTNIRGDTRVAGVVSTDPAYVMNSQLESVENSVCVALQGRVPCRVVGKIKKGDILVTSSIHGVAQAGIGDIKVGTVVGKALENYDSDHIGKIEIAVGRS